jgi:hypothetical protein
MLMYQWYCLCIKDGESELFEYLLFAFFMFPIFLIDLIAIPIEIIAFILWKIDRRKKNDR